MIGRDLNSPISGTTSTLLAIVVVCLIVWITNLTDPIKKEVDFSMNKPPYTNPLEAHTPEFVANLSDNMSVEQMVKSLEEVKNDSDLILLSQYINSENASAFCKVFKIEHKPKKGWFERDRQNTVAEFINKDLEIGPVGKHAFILRLVSNLQKDHDELAKQVAQYLFFVYSSKYAFSPEKILQMIPSKALFKTMQAFEELSRIYVCPNFTLDETHRRASNVNRAGTNWPLTMTQSLVNCMRYSPDEKRASLRIILSKATFYSKWGPCKYRN